MKHIKVKLILLVLLICLAFASAALALKPLIAGAEKSIEAIKQAGRYHAIETAKKQLSEAQQAIAPDQEQQPYTAVDKVESYTANIVHEVIQPPDHPPHRQHGNVSHRETHSRNSQSSKASTPKERMRREAIKEVRKDKAEAAQRRPQNVSHRETHSNAPQPHQAPTPKERMRRHMVQEDKKQKADASREQTKNLPHGETSFEVTEPPPAMPKAQMRQSYLQSRKRKQEAAHSTDKPFPDRARNDLPTVQKRSAAVRQEQVKNTSRHRRSREDRKQITGQRQRALPRDTSSSGASKAQIVKEHGRRYARD